MLFNLFFPKLRKPLKIFGFKNEKKKICYFLVMILNQALGKK